MEAIFLLHSPIGGFLPLDRRSISTYTDIMRKGEKTNPETEKKEVEMNEMTKNPIEVSHEIADLVMRLRPCLMEKKMGPAEQMALIGAESLEAMKADKLGTLRKLAAALGV